MRREISEGAALRGRDRVCQDHDLVALLNQVLLVEPRWERFREDLAYLSDFAVAFRYPGESADKAGLRPMHGNVAQKFRVEARTALNLDAE